MTQAVLQVIAGSFLLYLGATLLIRGASSLARGLGVAPAVVGLTVVAFGTSLPEFVVTVTAAFKGNADIALGNVVGSNIANIGLILGLCTVIRAMTVEFTMIRREVPLGLGAVVLVVLLSLDGTLGRGDGLVLLAGFAGFLYWSVAVERRAPGEVQERYEASSPSLCKRGIHALCVVGGLAGVVVGGNLLVGGGVTAARLLGVPPVIVGLTMVAVGTSLPEMATSLVAVAKGEDDLSVGNVLGSNLFNLLGVLGVAAVLDPIAVDRSFFVLQYPVLAGFTLALLPICRTGSVVSRAEGALLLAGYGLYVTWLYLGGGV
ncbi:calcium/sodium antiporter [Deferrisoma palaeochoriense]